MSDGDPRQRVLEAAGEVFAERGYQAATVREICQRAGVNLAAVNYYFTEKERLYVEAVRHAAQQQLSQRPPLELPADMAASEKLRAFIRMLLARILDERSPAWHAKLIMREFFEPTEACAQWVREFIRPQFGQLLAILDDVLPADTPAVKRHLCAFSIVGQCLYHRLARPVVALLVPKSEFRSYTAERLAEHIAEFSLAAVGLETPFGHVGADGRSSPTPRNATE